MPAQPVSQQFRLICPQQEDRIITIPTAQVASIPEDCTTIKIEWWEHERPLGEAMRPEEV